MGNQITVSQDLSKTAYDHLWMHFTRMSSYENSPVPTIVRGEGTYIWDDKGKRYLDGLAGLFVVNAGHGRKELAEVAYKQAQELAFFPIWSYAHPKAVELAERLAHYAPGDLNKVFFTTGGGEAVETAWKLAKQYFKLQGKHTKYKVISRAVATTHPAGRLSITGLPALKAPFEPLVPGAHKVPNTNIYRAPIFGDDPEPTAAGVPTRSSRRSSSRAPTPSPPSSWSRCRTPAAASRRRPATSSACARSATSTTCSSLRRDDLRLRPPRHHVRLRQVRLRPGHDHLCQGHDLGLLPDRRLHHLGPPRGAVLQGRQHLPARLHVRRHPVSSAVALANLDIFDKEGLNQHVLDQEGNFFNTLKKLHDLPIVGDVRGNGFFYGIELVKDKVTKESFTDEETERVLYGFLSKALFENGLYCRADDRGDPVIQLAPPLIADQGTFDEIEGILRSVLTEAWTKL